MVEYPENTVWYIEARPWNGPKVGEAGFAQVDPISRGSGVVIKFIKENEAGQRKPRSYILTCAHVVRDANDSLLEDIVCYPPGHGYVRTAENSRRCGTFPDSNAMSAKVSNLSPCEAVSGPRNEILKNDAAMDWVLLEIDESSFNKEASIFSCEQDVTLKKGSLTVIGYPFGAGTNADKQKGGDFWLNGDIVLATTAKDFHSASQSEPGMIDIEGPEETRPGMSGGGIFDDAGEFVGLHRSSTDSTMRRSAIRAETIIQWLRDTHQMEFSSGKSSKIVNWKTKAVEKRSVIAVGTCIFVLLAMIRFIPVPSPKPIPIPLKVYVNQLTEEKGRVPVAGLKVGFESDEWPGVSIDGETDSKGVALITFTPNAIPQSGIEISGYLVCRNEPAVLGDDRPFILYPHGRFHDDNATKERAIQLSRGSVECSVVGRNSYFGTKMTRALSQNATDQAKRPDPKRTDQDLNVIIDKISSELGLSVKQTQFATEGWSEKLQKERPVIFLHDLERSLPAHAGVLSRLAGSVGRLRIENSGSPYSASAFLVAENMVIVPGFAIPKKPEMSSLWIDFPKNGDFDSVAILKVIWKSDDIALCEISKTMRSSLKIGISQSMAHDSGVSTGSLFGRPIAVLGFPSVDNRLPKEMKGFFDDDGKKLAVMPGETLVPDNESPFKGELLHDATTSGGVGGGPVIDLETYSVIAMHKGGRFTGERKLNQATEIKTVWDDTSFQKAILPYAKLTIELLGETKSDPLKLSKSDRFITSYNPTFLGTSIPLPILATQPGSNEKNDVILDYVNFSVQMHSERRMATYAAANIDRSLQLRIPRTMDRWFLDPRIRPDFQWGDELYRQNDFDRGNLIARSAVAWGPSLGFAEKAAASTFYFPNATPQHKDFNQSGWAKLERKIYEELYPKSNRITVFCGPVFDPSDIKERDALVPRRFWMIGIFENPENAENPKVHAFLAEQYRLDASNEPVFVGRNNDCVKPTSVEQIQAVTGLRFSIPSHPSAGSP